MTVTVSAAHQANAILEARTRACGHSGSCPCRAALRRGRGLTHCPAHADAHPSLSVDVKNNTVLVKCQAGCSQVDVIEAFRGAGLWPEQEERANGKAYRQATYTRWPYVDEAGELLATHVRIDRPGKQKQMPWETADGRMSSNGAVHPETLPLYGLARLAEKPNAGVVVVEGEKAADAAYTTLGLVAVSLAGGAGQAEFGAALEPLRNRKVTLWPDNDEPGRRLMQRVAAALDGVASSVKWLDVPGLPPKGDAADYVAASRTRDELLSYVCDVPPSDSSIDSTALGAGKNGINGNNGGRPVGLVTMASVAAEQVRYLWRLRIPLGKVTVIEGDPDQGKSLITLDLAARISRGRSMPDGTPTDLAGPVDVIIMTAEDGLADTVRPRLEAADADLERVHVLDSVTVNGEQVPPELPRDVAELGRAIVATGAKLVVVDVLMAYLGSDVKALADQDIRRALRPLAKLAEDLGVAIVVLRHLTKGGGAKAVYRGGGAIGLGGAARSVLLVGADPDVPGRHLLARVKGNLAPSYPTLSYEIVADTLERPSLRWLGGSSTTAEEMLAAMEAAARDSATDRSAEEAYLCEVLADGERPADDIINEAEHRGLTYKAVWRACTKLRVQRRRDGFGGRMLWFLPTTIDSIDSIPPGVLDSGINGEEGPSSPKCRRCGRSEECHGPADASQCQWQARS